MSVRAKLLRAAGLDAPGIDVRTLLILSVGITILMMGTSIVSPVLPLYAKTFGATTTMVGFLVTTFGLARMLVDLPAGDLCERCGRRPLLVGGAMMVAVSSILAGLANSFPLLLLFRFCGGVGSAVYTTAGMTSLADIATPRSRGRIMSIYQGALLLGAGFGPAVGGFVAESYGLRAPFFAYGLLAFLCGLWVVLRGVETRDVVIPTLDKEGGHASSSGGSGLGVLLGNASFLLVGLVTFSVFFTRTGGRTTILPLFAYESLGISESQLGGAYSLMTLCNMLVLFPAGTLADRLGRKAAIVPSVLLASLAILLFTLTRNYLTFLGVAVLMGLATGIAGPSPAAYVADLTPEGQRGRAMGLYRTFGDVGFVIGPVLLGWVADISNYVTALQLNAALLIVGGLLFLVFARETVGRHRQRAVGPTEG
jgi:DHA1 family multidrug resistance protein-like MFS transporter